MEEIVAAFEHIAQLAYKGVSESSSDFRRDYTRATEDLETLAFSLGIQWEPPAYVQDIVEERWTSS